MWLIVVLLLLFSRKGSGGTAVNASLSVNPAAIPDAAGAMNPWTAGLKTGPSVGTAVAFPGNPDTRPGAWPGLAAVGADDPAINLSVGAPPPSGAGVPAAVMSNGLGTMVAMAPAAQVPISPAFKEIAPGISIPVGSNDGIIPTVSTVVTLPTANSTASFAQTQGVNTPMLGQL